MRAVKAILDIDCTLGKKAIIHQVTTMLSMSKNILFLGHNHLLATGADDQWLAGGYDLETGHFKRWIAWWLAGG